MLCYNKKNKTFEEEKKLTWLSPSNVCSVYSVGLMESTGPSIEGLDSNPAREPLHHKKKDLKIINAAYLLVFMATKGVLML